MNESVQDEWRERLASALEPFSDGGSVQGYGTLISYRSGGPDPLAFVATLRRADPRPHWLYVTQGFSEPHDDAKADELSGYGFELALRIPRAAGDNAEAPVGFVSLLQTLARYVFETGSIFVDGDHTALPEEVACLQGLSGLAFIADRELNPIETPAGTVAFRCAIGLTADELAAIQTWSTTGFIELALESGKLSPNCITVPGRASFLTDSAFRTQVVAGGARDGSRTGTLFLSEMRTTQKQRLLRKPMHVVTIDDGGLGQVLAVLPNRIAFQRALTLVGQRNRVRFEPADTVTLAGETDDLIVRLTAEAVAKIIRALSAGRQYSFGEIALTIERA